MAFDLNPEKKRVECLVMTPAIAKEIGKLNTNNYRDETPAWTEKIAEKLRRGEWEDNGETIKIHKDGLLLDGQHRLLACIKTGISFPVTIVFGLECSTLNIDRGMPRKVYQDLKNMGFSQCKNVASIARLAIMHNKGMWHLSGAQSKNVLESEVINMATENRDRIMGAAKLARLCDDVAPLSVIGALLFIGCENDLPIHNSETGNWFVNSLRSGENLENNQPVLHLRNRLLGQTKTSQLDRLMKRMICTIAWNKTVRGESCGPVALRLRLSGPSPQVPPSKVEQLT